MKNFFKPSHALPLLGLALLVMAGCNFEPENPDPVNFGEVYVGEKSDLLTRHWINNADEDVTLETATTRPPFAIENAGAFSSAQTVSANGGVSTDVQMSFTPTEAGGVDARIRPLISGASGVRAVPIQMNGIGVYAKNNGAFVLANNPPLGTTGILADLSPAPIQDNEPINWGRVLLGAPATEAEFRVISSAVVTGSASVVLRKGDQHFAITIPSSPSGIDIGAPGIAQGIRGIKVSFTPAELGTWTDILEVVDANNAANLAGIIVTAEVVTEEELEEEGD